MLTQNMSAGQEIWFRTRREQEDGRMRYVYGKGTIREFSDKTVILDGHDELEGQYSVRSYDCYADEFEMKMDKASDAFEDKIVAFSEKYISQCKDLLNGVTKGYMKNRLSPEAELIANDVQMKMRMFGAQMKEKFTECVDSFTKRTQDITTDVVRDKLGIPEDIKLEAKDLDFDERSEVTLTAEDLNFSQDSKRLEL